MSLRANLLSFTIALALICTACAANNNTPDQEMDENDFEIESKRYSRYADHDRQYNERPPHRLSGQERDQVLRDFDPDEAQRTAQRLAQLATRIEEVNDATAVVMGPWAVVGIDVDADLDRGRVGNIKYSVAEALKEDPAGAYAVVTADPDTLQRLREMSQAIRNGEPVEGVFNELAELVGRLMPQVPRHIEAPENPPQEKQVQDQPEQKDNLHRLDKGAKQAEQEG